MSRCLVLNLQKTPGDTAETSDDDHEITAEPVPHSSSSHWEWRPEYEVPPQKPGDSAVTRRRVVAKRPPTVGEEEIRQDRNLCQNLFPLTEEELSEGVFEIRFCSRHLVQNIVKIPVCRKLMCTLKVEIVPDR